MDLLIKKAQKGDKESFIQAINEYMGQMYRVAKSRLSSDNDVGDAIQETILSAYKGLPKLREPRYFKTWIIKILINKCNDITSRNTNITYIEDYTEISDSLNMDSSNEKIEDRLDFKKTLETLKEDYRTVVVLYYVNGFTTKEISEILGEKESTIKSRLNRARTQLKQHYIKMYTYNDSLTFELGGK